MDNVKAESDNAITSDSERDKRGSLALDQWRGFALVLVLISHGFFFTDRVGGIGRVGVNLFFFISGILVFRTLSRSKASTDWARARSFWWRRFRRLYPALVAYVALILPSMCWLQHLPNLPVGSSFDECFRDVWMVMFYLINYHGGAGAPMPYGHLWSLGCEMQFYLLAPLIYLAAGSSDSRRMPIFGCLLVILVGLGAIEPLVPKILAHFKWNVVTAWKYHFEFAVWPMMAGFFCEYRRDWFLRLPLKIVNSIYWLSLVACILSFALMTIGMEMKPLVIMAGAILLVPCQLAYIYGKPLGGWQGGCLRWLGERTYSIYLWQQPFTICNFLPNLLHPAGALASVAVGAVSFRLFEFPFLSVNRQKQERAR